MGSLSGGCIEEDLLEQLQRGELASEQPVLHIYGVTQAETERLDYLVADNSMSLSNRSRISNTSRL